MESFDDTSAPERCADCGADLESGERAFAVSDDSVICYACAVRRGGAYDELHDRWSPAPMTDDLLERDRPS